MTSRNQAVAEKLREAAEILAEQGANPFRIRAYRHAADTVAGLREDLRSLVEREGTESLEALPGFWHFTALFSNTAQAHRLGRTRDWVVIYFNADRGPEGQRTVVTETQGALAGRRVVRGREAECHRHPWEGLAGGVDHATA